jgi:hypothetical protein
MFYKVSSRGRVIEIYVWAVSKAEARQLFREYVGFRAWKVGSF